MKKGTSRKPLILGILGLITALPNAAISFFSSTMIATFDNENFKTGDEVIDYSVFYTKLIFWSALIGFIFSLISKRFYKTAGIIMILSGIMIFISMVTANLFLIFPATFYILGGVFCFIQKKTESVKTENS